jgi:hypothetical protein
MKEQSEQPYVYAKFHVQSQAILNTWHKIALAGKAPSEQIAADLVYFKNLLEYLPVAKSSVSGLFTATI